MTSAFPVTAGRPARPVRDRPPRPAPPQARPPSVVRPDTGPQAVERVRRSATRATPAVDGLVEVRERPAPPTARLGLAWAVVLVAALAVGPLPVLVLVIPVVAVGVASGLRAVDAGDQTARLGVVITPVLAGMSLVVAVAADPSTATILVGGVLLFDLANWVVGTGRTGGWLGALAGALTVLVLTVLVMAVSGPPLDGARLALAGLLLAVTLPVGVVVVDRLVHEAPVPALRRLDSLVVAGPVWVALGIALLGR